MLGLGCEVVGGRGLGVGEFVSLVGAFKLAEGPRPRWRGLGKGGRAY